MKRAACVLTALAALASLRPAVLAGQQALSQGLTIQVGVASGLTVLRDRDLNFGTLVTNSGVTTVTLASANVGKLHIYGGQNRTVNITLVPPATLKFGTNTIPYTWGGAYNEQLNIPTDPTTVTLAATTATFRLRDTGPTGNYGQAYLWIFGSVTVGAVPPGVYSGTFTISAAY